MSDEIIKEAKQLLLDEVNVCQLCGRRATEYEENPVTFGPDPYAEEIHDDHTDVWECDHCRYESSQDI